MASAKVRHEVTQPSDPSIKLIALTKGKNAIVDAIDYEWLNQWPWQAEWNAGTRSFYAVRRVSDKGKRPVIRMHRQILGLEPGDPRTGDHIEVGQTLDNRRSNLRIASHSHNHYNVTMRRGNTSGYKGVTYSKQRQKWQAQMGVNGKNLYLGTFNTPEAAYAAYCEAAKQHQGEFARL